ncbi:bile acid:Na+ symporter [Gracilaria domingensis]|nr:bile acid:Na+ symporter [Gracilaria domingensis]
MDRCVFVACAQVPGFVCSTHFGHSCSDSAIGAHAFYGHDTDASADPTGYRTDATDRVVIGWVLCVNACLGSAAISFVFAAACFARGAGATWDHIWWTGQQLVHTDCGRGCCALGDYDDGQYCSFGSGSSLSLCIAFEPGVVRKAVGNGEKFEHLGADSSAAGSHHRGHVQEGCEQAQARAAIGRHRGGADTDSWTRLQERRDGSSGLGATGAGCDPVAHSRRRKPGAVVRAGAAPLWRRAGGASQRGVHRAPGAHGSGVRSAAPRDAARSDAARSAVGGARRAGGRGDEGAEAVLRARGGRARQDGAVPRAVQRDGARAPPRQATERVAPRAAAARRGRVRRGAVRRCLNRAHAPRAVSAARQRARGAACRALCPPRGRYHARGAYVARRLVDVLRRGGGGRFCASRCVDMQQRRSYVELKVAAANLRGRRLDPFAVLARAAPASDLDEIARTEIVWLDCNPAFVTSFEVPLNNDALPECEFRLLLYSKSSRSDELRKNTFLGSVDFTLQRVLSKQDGVIERVLRGKSGKSDRKRGSVVICGEKVTPSDVKHMYSIQFGFSKQSNAWGPYTGRKAKRCFYVIYRAIINGVADEDWTPVYRSEILDPYDCPNEDIMFEGASLRAEHLYGMDENRGLRFEVFHYNSSGPHIPLGFVQTSASAFKYAKPGGKLYMVPVPGSTMKHAHVTLEMAKMGLTTRRGGVSSVFCLRATGFTWGRPGEGLEGDDYLERDAYGRTRIDHIADQEQMPRGVSYMGSRIHRMNSDNDDEAGDEAAGGAAQT